MAIDPDLLERLALHDQRWKYLAQYGNFSMAYSTLDRDLRAFEVPGKGYVAFAQVKPDPVFPETTLALGDPVCAASDSREVLAAFIEAHRDARGGGPGFIQVGLEAATALSEAGYYVSQLGVETRVELAGFSHAGSPRERLRHAMNQGQKLGYRVEELDTAADPAALVALFDISESWMSRHAVGDREMGFLNRHAVYNHEPFVRKVLLRNPSGTVEGFAFYDPVFRDGRIAGYFADITRMAASGFPLAGLFVHVTMAFTFQQEGLEVLELGLSPCYALERPPPEFRFGRVPHRIFRALWEDGENLYAFKGVAQAKRKWRGVESPAFVAFPSRRPVQHLLAGFKLTGLDVPLG